MFVTVNDDVKIHIAEQGEGPPLIFIAGGGFSGSIFRFQQNFFSEDFRMLVIDMRSHGKSSRVVHGMRISRLAKDLKEVVDSLKIERFNVIAHSLGCSVIYSFIDMFSSSQIEKAVLVDEPAALTINPAWSEKERLNFGATYDAAENYQFLNRMKGDEFDHLIKDVVDAMTTATASQELKNFIASCFSIDPEAAALLYHDNLCMDWRDVIPFVRMPVLVVGGRASITPWQSQEWISRHIPDAQLKIFEEQQAGSHFMFVENPAMFNEVVAKFLKG